MPRNDDAERYKNRIISEVSKDVYKDVESRQVEYITEVKGPLLDCDLLSISSSMLCLCKNNGGIELFTFGLGDVDDSASEVDGNDEETKDDPVEKLIISTKKISKQMGSEKF